MGHAHALLSTEGSHHVLRVAALHVVDSEHAHDGHRTLAGHGIPVGSVALRGHGDVQRSVDVLRAGQIDRCLVGADGQAASHSKGQLLRSQRHQRTIHIVSTEPFRHTAQAPRLALRTTVLNSSGEGLLFGTSLDNSHLVLLPLQVVLLHIYTPGDGQGTVAVHVLHVLGGDVYVTALHFGGKLLKVHLDLALAGHEREAHLIHLRSLLQGSGVLRVER